MDASMHVVFAIGNVTDEQYAAFRLAMLKNGLHPSIHSVSVTTTPIDVSGLMLRKEMQQKNDTSEYDGKARSERFGRPPETNYTEFPLGAVRAVIWGSDVSDEDKKRMSWLTNKLPANCIIYSVRVEKFGTQRLEGKAYGTLYVR